MIHGFPSKNNFSIPWFCFPPKTNLNLYACRCQGDACMGGMVSIYYVLFAVYHKHVHIQAKLWLQLIKDRCHISRRIDTIVHIQYKHVHCPRLIPCWEKLRYYSHLGGRKWRYTLRLFFFVVPLKKDRCHIS